jgi:extradiol dioxygenase family protein
VTYVQQNTEGKRFQNTEFLEFENGKLKAVEVYFGFDLAQSAKHSEKLSAVAQTNAVAVVAVKDLEKARRFYAETLGLEQSGGGDAEVLVFKSGDSLLNVYHSEYAGSNKATAVTWAVDGDVQDVVRALKARGVQFEHYDMPQTRIEGDVHVMQKIQTAWFKDPDGNILNIINRSA